MDASPITSQSAGTPRDRDLRGNLGAVAVTFMVIAAAAPLTVVGGLVPIGYLIGNGIGFPVMFLVATVILLLFSVGLTAMSRLPAQGRVVLRVHHPRARSHPGLAAPPTSRWSATRRCSAPSSATSASRSARASSCWAARRSRGGCSHSPRSPSSAASDTGTSNSAHGARRRAAGRDASSCWCSPWSILVTGGAEGVTFGTFVLQNILSGAPALGPDVRDRVLHRLRIDRRLPQRGARPEPHHRAGHLRVGYRHRPVLRRRRPGDRHRGRQDRSSSSPPRTPRPSSPASPRPTSARSAAIVIAVLFLGSMFAAVLSLHNVIARYQFSLWRMRRAARPSSPRCTRGTLPRTCPRSCRPPPPRCSCSSSSSAAWAR